MTAHDRLSLFSCCACLSTERCALVTKSAAIEMSLMKSCSFIIFQTCPITPSCKLYYLVITDLTIIKIENIRINAKLHSCIRPFLITQTISTKVNQFSAPSFSSPLLSILVLYSVYYSKRNSIINSSTLRRSIPKSTKLHTFFLQ